MNNKKILTCFAALFFGLASHANATLESRLGGLAFYDTIQDITWSANPFAAGYKTWDDHVAEISSLNIGGVTGWRMPSGGQYGVDEFLSLYFDHGITPATPGVFGYVPDLDSFWTDTEFSFDPTKAFFFRYEQATSSVIDFDVQLKNTTTYTWAVRDGDVGTVSIPAPGTLALIGLGLIGFSGMKRIRTH